MPTVRIHGEIKEMTETEWYHEAIQYLRGTELAHVVPFFFGPISEAECDHSTLWDLLNHGGEWRLKKMVAPNGKVATFVAKWPAGSLEIDRGGIGCWTLVARDEETGKEQKLPASQIQHVVSMCQDISEEK